MISGLMWIWNLITDFFTNRRKPILSRQNKTQTLIVSNNQSGGIIAGQIIIDGEISGHRFDSDRDECCGCVTLNMPGAECDVAVFKNPAGELYVSTGKTSGQLADDALKESKEYLASIGVKND